MSGAATPPVDTALILAGGLGTRLRAVVPDLPKPLAPVGGRPFLCHLLDYWQAQGIRRFILSVGYRAEAIIGQLGERHGDARLDYVRETEPLGTGGGFLLAAREVDDDKPVLLLNGDTFFAVDLPAFARFHAEQAADWSFATFRTAESGRYLGMQINSERQVTGFASGATEGWREANGGVYLCAPHRLLPAARQDRPQATSLENDLFPAWLAAGRRFAAFASDTTFIDIGVPDDYHRAAAVIAAHARTAAPHPSPARSLS